MTATNERIEAKLEGIRRAWIGIPDFERKRAIAFYINYAKGHQYFTGGDVLAAWRRTDDPIAQLDWRNRWGALASTMKSKKYQVIEFNRKVTPRNVQSHGDTEIEWRSLIYQSGETK